MDFTKTEYFNYLLANVENIKNELNEFNSEILNLMQQETNSLGLILKCHLIIEYYMDKYIKAAFPDIICLERLRMNFSSKLELINNPKTVFGIYYPGIKKLNAIRNKFAHNIAYRISEPDYYEIAKIMGAWFKALGNDPLTGHALIENFTLTLCGTLNSYTIGINEEAKDLGISGYLQWLKKMNEAK